MIMIVLLATALHSGAATGSRHEPPATGNAGASQPIVATAPAEVPQFPASWRGHWKGQSVAAGPGGEGARKPVIFGTELIIEPTGDAAKWTWTIVYDGSAGRQERKYHLVAIDAESVRTGRWKIDENNGIVLDASYIGGGLFCRFEVQGIDISVSYRVSGSGDERRLTMELVTTRNPGTDTGGKDDVPVVKTFAPLSVQRAEMRLGPATEK